MRPSRRASLVVLMTAIAALCAPLSVLAQSGETPPPPAFKAEELEQLVAPVALYPDALLAQVLMASTYPLEVVQAARWVKDNPSLKDQALQDALQQQTWDPSVKSLTPLPQVLTMMNEKLDWTQKLGDAFLAQQPDVMDAVQRLRAKAQAAGNLKSTAQQNVTVEQVPATVQQNVTVQQAPATTQVIKIEPANPQVIYVPTYNPTVVYGAWPYPAYPPYYYYPPGYVATTSLLSFGAGLAVGAALWGNCNWGSSGHSDVNVNVNTYNTFNKTNISNTNWQHNVEHRKGVQYGDNATAQKYGRGAAQGAQSRDAFRGRQEQARQQPASPGGARNPQANTARAADRSARPAATDRGAAAKDRGTASRHAGQAARQSSPQRTGTSRREPSAFQGMGKGQQTRAQSDRGRASRESAAAWGGGGRQGGGGNAGGGGTGRGGGGGRSGGPRR